MDDISASPASPGPSAQGGVDARAGSDDERRIEPAADRAAPELAAVAPSDGAHIRRLQQQVDELKRRLREATAQGSATAPELKASNDELQAMNGELRSSGAELAPSRGALRSINETLSTTNEELKVQLEALGRSNADLQSLMSGAAIPTVFLDRALRLTLFTPSAVELFNLVPADVGRPLIDLANALDYPQLGDDARGVVEHLRSVEREVRFGERWLLARLRPYRGVDDDRISGVVLVFVDITDRRRIAEALHESELLFRTIVTQAVAGVVRTDLDGRITLCNARFGQMVGVAPEALVGTSTFALVHPDDHERNVAAFRKMVEDGQPFEIEKRYLRADGATVWVSAAVTALTDGGGKPTAAVAIVIDVSERVHTQHALRESEERLRLVVESAREYAIVTLDLKRRVTGWNSGAEAMTGYLAEEMIGKNADVIFIEEERAAGVPQREAQQALVEGRAADERWHHRKNGTRFWGSGVMTVMRDVEGSAPVGLLKIFRDRTHERASEQALETSRSELVQALVDNRRARAEAEAANLAKDRFLAILSHELRTPLTPIVMALHALDRHPELPAALRGTVEVLRRNVKAELALIDDLLDVTRISSGKLEIAHEQTDMHEVIEAAVEICAGDFVAKRQRLNVALDAAHHLVAGDSARLQQVIWNLLKNASKFTADEGEVGVVTSNVGDRIVIVVADTGIGIGAEALSTIFDAFAQEGPWVTSEFGGLGLGLAIAKATVEAHHGTLTAASSGRGQGATFTIELPLN
jgi:two-component system CheB/CheR fusion protein